MQSEVKIIQNVCMFISAQLGLVRLGLSLLIQPFLENR